MIYIHQSTSLNMCTYVCDGQYLLMHVRGVHVWNYVLFKCFYCTFNTLEVFIFFYLK